LATEPFLYQNQQSDRLEIETVRFKARSVRSGRAPGPEFEQLAVEGEELIYVVTSNREFIVCEHVLDAHHSVLAGGGDVLAAGEVSLVVYADFRAVLDLNQMSGHYLPRQESLYFPAVILRDLGFAGTDLWLSS
jgi:hypothetical protein